MNLFWLSTTTCATTLYLPILKKIKIFRICTKWLYYGYMCAIYSTHHIGHATTILKIKHYNLHLITHWPCYLFSENKIGCHDHFTKCKCDNGLTNGKQLKLKYLHPMQVIDCTWNTNFNRNCLLYLVSCFEIKDLT